jgi:hypothetical protein
MYTVITKSFNLYFSNFELKAPISDSPSFHLSFFSDNKSNYNQNNRIELYIKFFRTKNNTIKSKL